MMSRKHLTSARASSLTGPPRSPSASHLVPAGARSTAWGRPWEFPKPPSSEFATISKRNTTWTREQSGAAAPPSKHTPCHHTAPGVPRPGQERHRLEPAHEGPIPQQKESYPPLQPCCSPPQTSVRVGGARQHGLA